MVALSTFENQISMIKSLIGECELSAPVNGNWSLVSAEDYESQIRDLAYGLMVKGYRRGDNVVIFDSTSQAISFVEAGCKLAHIQVMGFSTELHDDKLIDAIRESGARVLFAMNQSDVDFLKAFIKSNNLDLDVFSILGSKNESSIAYLQMIGATWAIKYKPAVDRVLREISLNS